MPTYERRKTGPKPTQIDVHLASTLYEGGMTIAQVAEAIESTPTIVRRRFKEAGVPIRPKGNLAKIEETKDMIKMRADGATWRHVAARYGITIQGCVKRVKRYQERQAA